jgi:hypothetical protein
MQPDFDLKPKAMLATYKMSGTARRVGAIGIMEDFGTVTVSGVESEAEARDHARDQLYSEGWEHVLIKNVEIKE